MTPVMAAVIPFNRQERAGRSELEGGLVWTFADRIFLLSSCHYAPPLCPVSPTLPPSHPLPTRPESGRPHPPRPVPWEPATAPTKPSATAGVAQLAAHLS